jgi:hypothetical protein
MIGLLAVEELQVFGSDKHGDTKLQPGARLAGLFNDFLR